MMHLFYKNHSQAESSLNVKKVYIFYILSLIFVNHVILPFIRTCRYIDYGGFKSAILVGGLLHIVLIYYFHAKKKLPFTYILIYALLVIFVVEIPYRILYWDITTISLPDTACRILIIILSCLFFKLRPAFRVLPAVLALSILFYCTFWGFSLWEHKVSFGTFYGIVKQRIDADMVFNDRDNSEVNLNSFSGDFILLDIWSTRCNYCYKSFPKLQNIYDEYANNQQVKIYAVHSCFGSEESKTGITILKNRGYTFPCLSANDSNLFLKECGVNGYPTVLILDKNKMLLFRGSLDNAVRYLKKALN